MLTPPIEKRRNEWLKELAAAVAKLERKVDGFKLESLGDSPAFVTTFPHVSQVTIRSHQREKLEALRNAVLHVAPGSAPDEDLQLMFVSWVDVFTATHLQVLRIFEDRSGFADARAAFVRQRELTDQVVVDLSARMLPGTENRRTRWSR